MMKIFNFFYIIYEFLFDRWTYSIIDSGQTRMMTTNGDVLFTINWTVYKKVDKFNNKVEYETKQYRT